MKTGLNGFLLHSLLQISDNPFAVVHRLLQSFTTSYSPSRFLAVFHNFLQFFTDSCNRSQLLTVLHGFLQSSTTSCSSSQTLAIVHNFLQSFTVSCRQKKKPSGQTVFVCWHLPIFPDRHQSSIFGTNELNFRVRHGNGWTLIVINTNYSILVAFDDFVIITLLFFTVKYSPHKRFLQFVYSV